MTHLLRRITNITFALLLAVLSVNLSGVMSLNNAYATPGNNGTLKVHEKGTPSGTESNDPKVCTFNFEGFNFDPNQDGYVVIATQPGGVNALTVPFGPANGSGYYATTYINDGGATITDGHYKATLYSKDTGNPAQPNLQDEKAKSKVFKVDCAHVVTPPAPTKNDVCGDDNDTYTIPSATGVTYKVKFGIFWITKSAGTYAASNSVTIKAFANNGYDLAGNDDNFEWTFTFSDNDCTVTPAAPTKVDLCGTANDTYTIPSTEGVTYQIKVGNSWVNKAAGTYVGAGMVEIRAVENNGYELAGNDNDYKWTFIFSATVCLITATPATPTNVDLCGKAHDTYTIPATTGVTYKVNGVTKAAGTYQTNIDVTITAHANAGYVLAGTASWAFNFNQQDCPVTATPPTMVELCGMANDIYTIPATDHVKYYKLTWFLIFPIYTELSAGIHQSGGHDVTIVAFAENGYDIAGQHVWNFDFSKRACPQPCHPSVDTYSALTFWHHDDDEEVPCIPTTVTPADPSRVDPCGTADDEYTIPSTTGVVYKVNGVVTPAGTHDANGTSVTVTAEAAAGYVLTGQTTWIYDFTNEDCPVVPCTPTMVSALTLSQANIVNANCPPGMGSGGSPTIPTSVTNTAIELPETGANPLTQLFSMIAAGIATYGAMFFILNRRDILARKQ